MRRSKHQNTLFVKNLCTSQHKSYDSLMYNTQHNLNKNIKQKILSASFECFEKSSDEQSVLVGKNISIKIMFIMNIKLNF
jgi:hypothetical protein